MNLISVISLSLLLVFLAAILIIYGKSLPALLSSARVSRHFYYSVIYAAGFLLPPEKLSGSWYIYMLAGLALMNLLFASSLILNNLYDVKIDRTNLKSNAMTVKGMSRKRYLLLYLASAAISVPLSLSFSPRVFLVCLCIHFCAWIYSCPPLRLKKHFPANTMLIAFSTVLAFTLGFYSPPLPGREFPLRLALAFFGALSLAFNTKDINDYAGDKKYGVSTLMTLLGPKKGKAAIAWLALAGYIFVPLILEAWKILPQAILCGGATCAHILAARDKVNEPLIFLIFFVFAGFFGAAFYL